METHEQYATIETAKLLKRAGFDWQCHAGYQYGRLTDYQISQQSDDVLIMDFNSAPAYMNQYSAPTLEVARKWLADVHNFYIEIRVEPDGKGGAEWFPRCYRKKIWLDEMIEDQWHPQPTPPHGTYEAALEKAIRRCLTILLQNKNEDNL